MVLVNSPPQIVYRLVCSWTEADVIAAPQREGGGVKLTWQLDEARERVRQLPNQCHGVSLVPVFVPQRERERERGPSSRFQSLRTICFYQGVFDMCYHSVLPAISTRNSPLTPSLSFLDPFFSRNSRIEVKNSRSRNLSASIILEKDSFRFDRCLFLHERHRNYYHREIGKRKRNFGDYPLWLIDIFFRTRNHLIEKFPFVLCLAREKLSIRMINSI